MDPGGEIAASGIKLKEAFTLLLDAVGEGPVRPVDFAAATGIGKDISYRVIRATRADDPLAVAHLMPGPAPLRRLVAGARKRGTITAGVAEQASAAVDAYERVIAAHAGDRTGLDLLISEWIPEVRSKLSFTARQALFRAYAQIYGASCETFIDTTIIVPNADGDTLDGIVVRMLHRIWRNRSDARVVLPTHGITTPGDAVFGCNLRGEPARAARELILADFSSNLLDDVELIRFSDQSYVLMQSTGLGLQGAASLTTAERAVHCFTRRYPPDSGRPLSGPVCEPTVPARELVFDVLLHPDVFPNQRPVVFHFDTARFGLMSVNDPERDTALMAEPVDVQAIGTGIEQLRLTSVRQYVPCLQHVFRETGHSPADFRAFRIRLEYPMLSNQISAAFRKE